MQVSNSDMISPRYDKQCSNSLIHIGRYPPYLPWPDIGYLAKWSVSSYKFGFGPECLRDGDPETFWQYVIFLPLLLIPNRGRLT